MTKFQYFETRILLFVKRFLIVTLVLFCLSSNAQQEAYDGYSSKDVERLINFNPVQSLDAAQLLLSRPNIAPKDKAQLIFLIYKAQKVKGNYGSALNFLFEERKYTDYLTEQDKIDVEIEKVKMLRALSLDKQSKMILDDLVAYSKGEIHDRLEQYLHALIALENAKNLEKQGKFDEGIRLLDSIQNSAKGTFKNYPDFRFGYFLTRGFLCLKKNEIPKAEKEFEYVIADLDSQKNINLFIKAMALSGLGEVRFFQKRHTEALSVLSEALLNAKRLGNVFLQEAILQQQHDNYIEIKDAGKYKLTNAECIKAQVKADSIIQESVNISYNLITNEKSEQYHEKEKYYITVFYFIGVLFVLLIGYYFFLWRKHMGRYKNLDEVIKYVGIMRNEIHNVEPLKNQVSKKYVISKELEDEILKKLKRFENSKKFLNKDISLSVLAVQFDTNVKYLSDVINSNYNLNFNTYINTLRINYIVEKLKTDPDFKNYKISYLAEYCGFSAHSSFATVFKSITGISPVKFIELLNNENENTLLQ